MKKSLKEYNKFISNKKHTSIEYGIPAIWYPENMFDFQKYITEITLKKGRYGNFLDTGTGKTLIELTVAYNHVQTSNKRVLIITPLAVAFQFIEEATKFGVDDISYSKDGKFKTKIVICNYERLSKFDAKDFETVILDESSILKNFNGAIKSQVTTFMKKVKYRYLFTATPSPNDFDELGTSSEALGYLGYMDMLGKYFANNENNIRPQDIHSKWYVKPHAYENFFRWANSWSISMRKPEDLGFDGSMFVLPELIKTNHLVKNKEMWKEHGMTMLFNKVARTMSEVREEQKMTIIPRCEKAVEAAEKHDITVYWCNFNKEGDLIQQLDKEAYQISGSMKLEKKEELLLAFANGEIKKLITKPRITAFGLNWQHCNHTVFFPTFSYEQYYQAIRRFLRFGQKNNVNLDMIYSDGQERVLKTLEKKTKRASLLYDKLISMTRPDYVYSEDNFNEKIELPKFL